MNKIKISTPYRAELLVKPDIHVNDSGNIVIDGIPCVTYEMCNKELCLSAFSDNGELNYEGQMIDWDILLDDKPLEEGASCSIPLSFPQQIVHVQARFVSLTSFRISVPRLRGFSLNH